MIKEPRGRGFTLVEMLVVIAIIVVLMAILFPVFSRVRAHARKTKCISNLHQITLALRSYKNDYGGRYPPPPVFVNGRYYGGLSALYPDYIDNLDVLICPDDPDIRGAMAQARQVVYSSYNGRAIAPRSGNWAFAPDQASGLPEVYYNYNGYTFLGAPGGPINSSGVDNGGVNEAGYVAAVMSEYRAEGLRQRDLPRLANRAAPGTTIVTHCPHHRGSGSLAEQTEILARLDGTVDSNAKRGALEQDPDDAGPKVAPYLSQRK